MQSISILRHQTGQTGCTRFGPIPSFLTWDRSTYGSLFMLLSFYSFANPTPLSTFHLHPPPINRVPAPTPRNEQPNHVQQKPDGDPLVLIDPEQNQYPRHKQRDD